MTTICTVPYDKGVIVFSDTRATDTQTLDTYLAVDKTSPNLCSIHPDLEIYASGAGLAGCIEAVAHPAIAYFELKCLQLHIDPHSLSAANFIEVFSNLMHKSTREQIGAITGLTQLEDHILSNSRLILTVKTRKFVCSFAFTFLANCFNTPPYVKDHSIQTEEDQNNYFRKNSLLGTGSGSRYILGALMVENSKKPFYQRSLKQVCSWIYKNFANAIVLDRASSILEGFNLRIVSCEPNISTKNYLLFHPKISNEKIQILK